MKKLITTIISLILVAATLVACSKTNSNTNETTNTESGTQAQAVEQTQESTTTSTANASTTPNTFSKYVIVSFNAVQGAVIYNQDYDIHGYLESCQYHKKCEACGYVSNSNGQARGNTHTSYYCTQCGNNQEVEITVDQQWAEIQYEN